MPGILSGPVTVDLKSCNHCRNSSCGKVMFSQVSVNMLTVEGGNVSLVPRPFLGEGRYLGDRVSGEVGYPGVSHLGVLGVGIPPEGTWYQRYPTPLPLNHKSGRCASYWNAFLLVKSICLNAILCYSCSWSIESVSKIGNKKVNFILKLGATLLLLEKDFFKSVH